MLGFFVSSFTESLVHVIDSLQCRTQIMLMEQLDNAKPASSLGYILNCRTVCLTSYSVYKLKSRSTARTFFCVCHTSGCSFYVLKAVLAVWQHVQLMLHAQTARCPIVNSCSELPSLWSGEICKHLGLTERARGISHVNLDLLGDIHCSVKDEPHRDLFLVNTIAVSVITQR